MRIKKMILGEEKNGNKIGFCINIKFSYPTKMVINQEVHNQSLPIVV